MPRHPNSKPPNKTSSNEPTTKREEIAKARALVAELEWAKVELLLETLETRKNDSLDFHEIPVWSIRDVVRHAFESGYRHGRSR